MDNVHRLSFVRLIGFSLFWTWLFLVAVSPSPTFGQLLVPWAIPFEIPEVGFRIAFLLVALSLRHLLATRMGSLALAAICVVAGPLTTLTLCLSPLPTFILFASVLAALTDAAMFLMWLCYFGYSKIGQTAFLLVISYALGSVLCLAAIALGHNAMVALSAAAPIASGIAFIAATRNDAAAQRESLFEPADRPSNVSNIGMPKSLVFASIALALYAFVFAFFFGTHRFIGICFLKRSRTSGIVQYRFGGDYHQRIALFEKKLWPLRGLPQHSIDFRPRIRSVRRCAECGIIHRWRMHYARLFAFRSTLVKRLLQRS